MTITPISAVDSYYIEHLKTLSAEASVRSELLSLGVTLITAEYDGVGDSGQIEDITFFDSANPPQEVTVSKEAYDRVESLLYALIEVRHPGWEIDDGGCGDFQWDLQTGGLTHQHHRRYLDQESSMYEGFDITRGAVA